LLHGRGAYDQVAYHEPTIRAFATAWPALDYSAYRSATTPGYHTLLALWCRYLSCDSTGLRIAGALVTALLLGILAGSLTRRVGAMDAIILSLPFAASTYVFSSGVYLLPDNAGWLGVLVVLLLALGPWRGIRTLALGGLTLLLLVFTRQVHVWVLAPLCAAAWLGDERPSTLAIALVRSRPRIIRLACAGAACLPALLLLAWFVHLWGGLTPPGVRDLHAQGVNLAGPAFVLALLAIATPFFGVAVLPNPSALWASHRRAFLLTIVAGVLVGALPPTSYDAAAGRWSGLWNGVQRLPTLADRSPVMIALATAGAVSLLTWSLALATRDRWIVLVTLAGFVAAQSASFQLWQRYSEPFVLMVVGLMAARISRPAGEARLLLTGPRALAPLALALVLAAVTMVELPHGTEVR
jgi:hypothetical protein